MRLRRSVPRARSRREQTDAESARSSGGEKIPDAVPGRLTAAGARAMPGTGQPPAGRERARAPPLAALPARELGLKRRPQSLDRRRLVEVELSDDLVDA
jgi:hypothetical protein